MSNREEGMVNARELIGERDAIICLYLETVRGQKDRLHLGILIPDDVGCGFAGLYSGCSFIPFGCGGKRGWMSYVKQVNTSGFLPVAEGSFAGGGRVDPQRAEGVWSLLKKYEY